LASIESTAEPMRRFRDAKHAHNVKEASAAEEAILAQLPKTRIDVKFLRRRLDHVEESLKSVPEDKLRGLESRYLDLAGAAMRRGLEDADYVDLANRIAILEREIAATKR
jgi:hypothetical protein